MYKSSESNEICKFENLIQAQSEEDIISRLFVFTLKDDTDDKDDEDDERKRATS